MLSSQTLKKMIYAELKEGGFQFKNNELIPPDLTDKDALRKAHAASKKHLLEKNKTWIIENEKECLENFAEGDEIRPDEIYPELVLVDKTLDRKLFRYASYLWSIPLSNGFGRRLRYLVKDKSNGKVIGIFALTDPVIGLKVRDNWIGWSKQQKENMLWHVMDVYAFGAIKPYSYLLGGKLVATLATATEVRKKFEEKYSTGRTQIMNRNYKSRKGGLALITTTGAYGKSSILDRLKRENGELLWNYVGATKGWGSFHLNNGIATKMIEYLRETDNEILDMNRFGDGPNWKLRVLRACIKDLGLNYNKYGKHGIKRGFYAAPLISNFKELLNGDAKRPKPITSKANELFEFFRDRYLLPRTKREDRWKSVSKEEFKLSTLF